MKTPYSDQVRLLVNLLPIVDWRKFPLPEAQMLPAIQWKQLNLERMAPKKRRKATHKLEKVLFG